MGWASGGDIIDGVASELMAGAVDPAVRERVYRPLVDALKDQDWDTESESIGIDPVLDRVLMDACPWLRPGADGPDAEVPR